MKNDGLYSVKLHIIEFKNKKEGCVVIMSEKVNK